MYTHGGYLRVGMCVMGPKGMVGHGNEARGGTGGRCGREFGHVVYAKYTKKRHNKTGDTDGRDVDGWTHGA